MISSGTVADSTAIKRQFAKSSVITAASISAKQTRVVRIASANTSASKAAVLDVKKYRTISAKITVSTRMEAYRTDRDIRAEMTDYLPRYYGDFPVVSAMIQAEASEATRLHALVEALVFEFYPETATDIGITRFEAECGIVTDRTKSLEARRSEVIKRRRGIGTVTLPKFTGIVNEFYDCTVEEKPNEFRVATTIWSKRGVPENIAEMEREVNAVLPAHLEHEFVPTWLTWGEIEDYGLTGEEAEQYTGDELSKRFLFPYLGGRLS
ncbi:putative phage tail protein [Paenibacillus shunpengii]|uniref:Phage tail protein n=1 Tax=Paenibacillus shunpengii TaxID=2054424 RepID=A0ABW5ST69_9BACL